MRHGFNAAYSFGLVAISRVPVRGIISAARPALGAVSIAVAAAATTPLTASTKSDMSTKVYLDHDGGLDDFVALVYLLEHQQR